MNSLDLQAFLATPRASIGTGARDDGPLVSIVMPSFNQVAFIERSILSVLNQDYPNVEFIIADGGSTDGTVDIIRKYERQLASWLSEPDSGQSEALNRGFSRATGEILGWMNSDDLYTPGAIRLAVDAFRRTNEATVVFGDWCSIDEHDQVIEEHTAFDFNLRHFIYEGFTHNSQGMFWRKAAHERFGEFDINLHRTMDYDLIVRLGVAEGARRFTRIPKVLACFRRHPDQKTQGMDAKVIEEHQRIARNLGFEGKFEWTGRAIRLAFRGRRAFWYARRRGLGFVASKLWQSSK